MSEPTTSTPGIPEPLFNPKLEGQSLVFEVSHRRAHPPGTLSDPPVHFRLKLLDHDKAELYVEMLRKNNFPAIAAEIPEKPGVFRVLVGPVSDVAKTRADLQNASFPGKEALVKTF